MRVAQGDHLLGHDVRRAPGVFGGAVGEVLQGRVPASFKAGLPDIEGAAADVSRATGMGDIARRLPGFEQQAALLGGSEGEVDAFRHRRRAYPKTRKCAQCICPLHFADRLILRQQDFRGIGLTVDVNKEDLFPATG